MSERTISRISTNGGLFVSNPIQGPRPEALAEGPCKSIPVGLLREDEKLHPEAMNVVETIQKVNSANLSAFESNEDSRIAKGMGDKLSNCTGSEVKFCFWLHSYNFPISKRDAQTIVKLSEEYSDVITPPLQHNLLRAILYDDVEPVINQDDEEVLNPDDPDLLRLYRIGVERYLEAAKDSKKQTMAPVPFLRDEEKFMKDLLTDYSEYNGGLNFLSFNFHRRKPTSKANRDVLRNLVSHMRRIDYFDATFRYAINVLHSYKDEEDLRTPEDVALACMGFDVIGENHWRPQSDHSGDWDLSFRVFDNDIMSYREISDIASDLSEHWPDNDQTGLDVNAVLDANLDREKIRAQKLVNAEQVELGLEDLRGEIHGGDTRSFVHSHRGLRPLQGSFSAIASEYKNPSTQASFEEYS